MHDGMPYGRNQGQGQGHSREVDRQSPMGLIFVSVLSLLTIEGCMLNAHEVKWIFMPHCMIYH